MEPVDVLSRVQGLDDAMFVDSRRQWKLNQDPVNRRVVVQAPDDLQQFVLGSRLRQALYAGFHAGLARHLFLVAHVDLRGRVLPDQHDRQSGRDSVLLSQSSATLRDFRTNLLSSGLAVEDLRGASLGRHLGSFDHGFLPRLDASSSGLSRR